MRKRSLAALVLALAALVAAAPGSAYAGSGGGGRGWEPAPTPPYDVPAGARCDFAYHTEPSWTRCAGSPCRATGGGMRVI